jgi:hypothetical protein
MDDQYETAGRFWLRKMTPEERRVFSSAIRRCHWDALQRRLNPVRVRQEPERLVDVEDPRPQRLRPGA